ncbi:ankyrin repeat domain-containing protein [Aestuariibius insulae]
MSAKDAAGCFDAVLKQAPEDRRESAILNILDAAIYAGNLPLVRAAIEAGALTIDHTGVGLSPPLFEAIRWGQPETVDLLLEAGADPDLSVGDEQSAQQPLLLAALGGEDRIMRSLLDAGADPTGTMIVSPLVIAARDGQAGMVNMLVEAGGIARFHPEAPEGMTLIEMGIYGRGDRGPVISALIAGGEDPAQPMSRGELPLFTAAVLGQGGVVRTIVDDGVPVDMIDQRGFTALVAAAEAGSLAGLSVLLELGADPDFDDGAAARQAELNGEDLILEYLRAVGDSAAQQQILNNALEIEVLSLFAGEAEALMQEGADPNAWVGKDHLLNRIECSPRIGTILLDGGADPDLMLVESGWMPWVMSCGETAHDGAEYLNRLGWAK